MKNSEARIRKPEKDNAVRAATWGWWGNAMQEGPYEENGKIMTTYDFGLRTMMLARQIRLLVISLIIVLMIAAGSICALIIF